MQAQGGHLMLQFLSILHFIPIKLNFAESDLGSSMECNSAFRWDIP